MGKEVEIPRYDWEGFYEFYRMEMEDFAHSFEAFLSTGNIPEPARTWKVFPSEALQNIWVDRVLRGYVRRVKALSKLKHIMIKNVARLAACTDLSGHSSADVREDLAECSEYLKAWLERDKPWLYGVTEYQDFLEYWLDVNGTLAYSDYALPKFAKVFDELLPETCPEKTLVLIDAALGVWHQRGDLSLLLVKGGVSTLDTLFEAGT